MADVVGNDTTTVKYLKRSTEGFDAVPAIEAQDGLYLVTGDGAVSTYKASAQGYGDFTLRRQYVDEEWQETITLGLGAVDDGLGDYRLVEFDTNDQFEGYQNWQLYETGDNRFIPMINNYYLGIDENGNWALTDSADATGFAYGYAVTPGEADKLYGITDTLTDEAAYVLLSDCPDLYLGMQAMRDGGENLDLQQARETTHAGDTAYAIPADRVASCTWTAKARPDDKFLLTKMHDFDGELIEIMLYPNTVTSMMDYSTNEAIEDYTPYEWELEESTNSGYVLKNGSNYAVLTESGDWAHTAVTPDESSTGARGYVNVATRLS